MVNTFNSRSGAVVPASGDYTAAMVGAVPAASVAGATNYVPVFTSANAIGNSVIYQSGSNIGIGSTAPQSLLTLGNVGNLPNANTQLLMGTNVAVSTTVPACRIAMAAANNAAYCASFGLMYLNSTGPQIAAAIGTWEGTNDYSATLVATRGQVGIGTVSPAKALDVNGVITPQDGGGRNYPGGMMTEVNSQLINFGINEDSTNRFGPYNSTFQGGMIRIDCRGSTPVMTFNVRPAGSTALMAQAMAITSSGNVGIGMVPSYQLQLSTDAAVKPSGGSWTVPSDARLKQNIRDLEGGLAVIERLHVIEAEYNGLAGTPAGARVVGFLAHELREILPTAVGSVRGKLHPKDKEHTDILDMNLHEVLMHLILAVQQLARKTGN